MTLEDEILLLEEPRPGWDRTDTDRAFTQGWNKAVEACAKLAHDREVVAEMAEQFVEVDA